MPSVRVPEAFLICAGAKTVALPWSGTLWTGFFRLLKSASISGEEADDGESTGSEYLTGRMKGCLFTGVLTDNGSEKAADDDGSPRPRPSSLSGDKNLLGHV